MCQGFGLTNAVDAVVPAHDGGDGGGVQASSAMVTALGGFAPQNTPSPEADVPGEGCVQREGLSAGSCGVARR